MKKLLLIALGIFLSNQVFGAHATLGALNNLNVQLTELTSILQQVKREIAELSDSDIQDLLGYHDALEEQLKKKDYENAQISLQIFTDLVKKLGGTQALAYLPDIKDIKTYIADKRTLLEKRQEEAKIMSIQKRPSPNSEFHISLKNKDPMAKFSYWAHFSGNESAIYHGLPMIGHYADPYALLVRIAIIEYVYSDKIKALLPAALQKTITASKINPEVYALIWIKPRTHAFASYNLIYHPVIKQWTGENFPNKNVVMGIFDPKGVNCSIAQAVPCNGVGAVNVNLHAGGKATEVDFFAFSPDNARFVLENKPIATFWSYMNFGGKSIVTYNIIINNPALKESLQKITENSWTFKTFIDGIKKDIGADASNMLINLAA